MRRSTRPTARLTTPRPATRPMTGRSGGRKARLTAALTLTLAATAVGGIGVLAPATAQTTAAAPTTATSGDTTATAEPVTTHERGVVLECTGSRHGLDAYVSLYENNLHGNVVQVILDDSPRKAATSQPADILSAGEIRTGVRIGEHRAVIRGTAYRVPVALRSRVHEEMDDAGQHIVADGFQRDLVEDLALRYDGTRVPLSCDPAFAYRLTVTKTDITGG